MKDGWEYKKLGEVCKVIMGQSPDGNSVNASKGIEFHQGKVFFGEKYLNVSNTFTEQPSKIAEPNSVLLCVRAPVGIVNITPRRICVGRGLCAIQPNDNIILPFLFYALTQKQAYFDKNSTGSTFKAISSKVVINTDIPIPSIAEQERIVAELDLLSSVLEKKKAQLKEIDQLAQSIFYEMFGDPITNEKGWDVKKLGEIATEKLTYGSGASAVPFNGSIRYVRITDINDNGELNDNSVSPNVEDERYILNDGDILFARSGATVGKTYCHKSKYGKCLYAGYLIRFIPNRSVVLPNYVFYSTKTPYYKAFINNAQNAVAQPNINAKQYSSLLICVPPLSLQQEFAEKIEAIEQQKSLIQQSIVEVQTMFDYTMDKYFG